MGGKPDCCVQYDTAGFIGQHSGVLIERNPAGGAERSPGGGIEHIELDGQPVVGPQSDAVGQLDRESTVSPEQHAVGGLDGLATGGAEHQSGERFERYTTG